MTLSDFRLFTTGGMAFFACGEVRLVPSRVEKPQFDHSRSILQRARDRGRPPVGALTRVRFEAARQLVAPMSRCDLSRGFFHHPDNNIMALMSEVPRSASSRIESKVAVR